MADKYVLTDGSNNIVEYPYSLSKLLNDNPNTTFPANLRTRLDTLASFNVYKVVATPQPAANPDQMPEEVDPVFDGGVWNQRWTLRSASAEEESVRANILKTAIADEVQGRLDAWANTRGYSSILSTVTYENDLNPKFAQEAADAKRLRSETWTTLYTLLAEVEAGDRPVPSGLVDIENELPDLVWTE